MPSRSKRLVIFGDSNIAAVKHAVDEGLLVFDGWEHEFWGAAGPEYRHIHFGKGALQPIKPEALEQVLLVNGNRREKLGAKDFDLFVFYGVRLRLAEFFAPYLNLMMDAETAVSGAVLRRAAARFLNDRRSVRMAQKLREAGAKKIVFAYAGFPVWGVVNHAEEGRVLEQFPKVAEAGEPERARIWAALEAEFEARGLSLIRQPKETLCNGMFTKEEYAVAGAAEREDANHKSAAYAAATLADFLP